MQFVKLLLAYVVLLSSIKFISFAHAIVKQTVSERVLQDDASFWDRFVKDVTSSSFIPIQTPVPTSESTPSPTPEKTPPPTPEPTPEPSKSPTAAPSQSPTDAPSQSPTDAPSKSPTDAPSKSPTDAPSKSPTDAPSKSPTDAPSKSPTDAPSKSPTNAPSNSPADAPSKSATNAPSAFPTDAPSVSPTDVPSATPTDVPSAPPTELPVCLVDVTVECMSEDGTECKELETPQGSCTLSGEPITELKFSFVGSRCGDALNAQQLETMCTDFATFPSDSEVSVSCKSATGVASGIVVTPNMLLLGDIFAVSSPGGAALPTEIMCVISDGRTTFQEFTFLTGEGNSLSLKDKFGSFELESCTNEAGSTQDCQVLLNYLYVLKNVGTYDLDFTLLERNRNNLTESLLPLLDVAGLSPGEETSVTEQEIVDICIGSVYTTMVVVEANPPNNGITCFDQDEYTFITEVGCKVDIEIMCETETGVDCSDLTSPKESCTSLGNGLTALVFQYEDASCGSVAGSNKQPGASCFDFEEIPTGTVDLTCSSVRDDVRLNLSPSMIMPGDTIVMTTFDGSPLPTQIRCLISEAGFGSATVFQEFSFFTGDGYELNLQDKFGSLTLLSCTSDEGQLLECEVLLSYEYNLRNIGTNDIMDISLLERTRDEVTESLLDLIGETNLEPGASIEVVETALVNLCVEGVSTTSISVAADPPNGMTCYDQDEFSLSVLPPCQVFVEVQCNTLSGVACTNLEGEQLVECNCNGCATELIYLYTGASCGSLEGCLDAGPNEDSARIVVQGNGTFFFDGTVDVDQSVVISNNGECLPNTLNVTVSPVGALKPSQSLSIDSSCVGSVTLLDAFGALDFIGYTCPDGIPRICFVEVEYNITTSNVGSVAETVDSWEFNLNGEITMLPEIPVASFESKEGFSVVVPGAVSLCENIQYVATSNVTAVGVADGQICESAASLNFDITTGTPFPTLSPSESPTRIPSDSPSTSPTTVPTPEPTPAPTPEPTSAPTTEPTSVPTLGATPEQSSEELKTGKIPTEVCEFDLEIVCIPPEGSLSCNEPPHPIEKCSGRPFEMVFQFNGGNCDQSYNVQGPSGMFFCNDQGDGVPTEYGEKAYILVTDLNGETVFHNDWVEVGSLFTLSDNGSIFPTGQLITIFNSNDTSNPDNILQAVQYNSSCSQNLFLKDRFGAVQLVIWANKEQGTVSCFTNQTFSLDITVPLDNEGGPGTLETLIVASNMDPFFFNLTDKVAGKVADIGETIQVDITIPVDLTQKRTYNLLFTLTAVTQLGQECRSTELTSFTAGYSLPPIFPTFSPTQAPSIAGSITWTSDPSTSTCNLEAGFACQTASGRSCTSLRPPSSLVCASSNGTVSSLDFIFSGKGCGATDDCKDATEGGPTTESHVYIFAEGGGNSTAFEGVVRLGESFRISSGLEGGRLSVMIWSVSNEKPQFPLQILDAIYLGCEGKTGDDLTLLNEYGALSLIGFTNPDQGFNSIYEDVTMSYTVRNNGALRSNVLSAVPTSPFEDGSVNLLQGEDPLYMDPGEKRTFVGSPTRLNLEERTGGEFRFDLDVSGKSVESGLGCSDSKSYVLRVLS